MSRCAPLFLISDRVVFEGEDAVDAGGVTKELFALAMKDYLESTTLLQPCGDFHHLWFTRTPSHSPTDSFDEYLLGIFLGLACYNGILVNLPIAPVVYKLFNGGRISIEDLWAVDSSLARGLQALLDYAEVGTSFADVFGISFVATSNPLVVDSSAAVSTSRSFVELKPGGSEIQITRANRQEFVELFVQHALYRSCQEAVDNFISGLRVILHNQALSLCTSAEVSPLLPDRAPVMVPQIEMVICGSSDILDLNLADLRSHTSYLGEFHDRHPVICMFWVSSPAPPHLTDCPQETIGRLNPQEFRQFLLFLTATDRVPVGGLKQLRSTTQPCLPSPHPPPPLSSHRLTIQPTLSPPSALPVAHTCFNLLDLPSTYQSVEQLRERLLVALQHSQGFGLA
jgi:E3 ubiquitin-protein ligase HERC4